MGQSMSKTRKKNMERSDLLLWMVAKSESPVENGGLSQYLILFVGFQTSQIGGAGFLPSTKNHHIIWDYQTSLRFWNVSKDIAFFSKEWTGQIWDPGQSFKP
jgi:hypothetical protein